MVPDKVVTEEIGKNRRSAIDTLGLGEKVLQLRRNLTLEEVADRINKIKPEGTPNIGISQIAKYCEKHGVNPSRQSITKVVKSMHINTLEDAVAVQTRVARHVRKLEHVVDKVKDDEEKLSEIASISNAYLNACKCLLDVNRTISKIEKEHLGHDKVRKVLKTLLEVLEEFPEVKTRFFEKLRESTVYDTIKYV